MRDLTRTWKSTTWIKGAGKAFSFTKSEQRSREVPSQKKAGKTDTLRK